MPTSENIIKAIAEQLGLAPEDLELGSLLREELELGPLELNDLLLHLSQRFNIIFETQDMEHLHKIEDLVLLVEDKLLDG